MKEPSLRIGVGFDVQDRCRLKPFHVARRGGDDYCAITQSVRVATGVDLLPVLGA
jgi:hypothetical protein